MNEQQKALMEKNYHAVQNLINEEQLLHQQTHMFREHTPLYDQERVNDQLKTMRRYANRLILAIDSYLEDREMPEWKD